jgi:hypothetical protein
LRADQDQSNPRIHHEHRPGKLFFPASGVTRFPQRATQSTQYSQSGCQILTIQIRCHPATYSIRCHGQLEAIDRMAAGAT